MREIRIELPLPRTSGRWVLWIAGSAIFSHRWQVLHFYAEGAGRNCLGGLAKIARAGCLGNRLRNALGESLRGFIRRLRDHDGVGDARHTRARELPPTRS